METTIIILSVIGILVSLYALRVQFKLKKKSYEPWCDISDRISCSKAFQSVQATVFKIPNTIAGIVLFTIIIILGIIDQTKAILYVSLAMLPVNIYLLTILLKQRNFCIICVAMHAISLSILTIAAV